MSGVASVSRRHDGQLWLIALGLSLLVNLALMLGLGLFALQKRSAWVNPESAPEPAADQFVTIFPEIAEPAMAAQVKRFARTAPDQAAERPQRPSFQGERDTRATSDRAPEASAPALPSQAGRKPLNPNDFETTESDYRDGKLEAAAAPVTPESAARSEDSPPVPEAAGVETGRPTEMMEKAGTAEAPIAVAVREKLYDGPNPVETPVPKPIEIKEAPVAEKPALPKPSAAAKKPAEDPKPKVAKAVVADPAFSGFQRKTAIQGSISRNGRSALDVEDSPLGRYQALISRAVEQEWQRNCVRHRDFITPGFLTVRFFVEQSGKVRTVQFVGEMETGEVQKGFTLNAIRDAEIPPMSPALKKQFADEPLEIIFNFYF